MNCKLVKNIYKVLENKTNKKLHKKIFNREIVR